MDFEIFTPTKIIFGPNSLSKLRSLDLGSLKRGLIVINSQQESNIENSYLDKVKNFLGEQSIESVVFDGVNLNPSIEEVNLGTKVAIDNGCDFVIALGSAGTIDCAKNIAIMAKNYKTYLDYIKEDNCNLIENEPLKIVTIPTTSENGTEVTCLTIIRNSKTYKKISLNSKYTFPILAIIDPILATTIEPFQTAYTGFNLLCQAIECYISNRTNPFTEILSLESIKYIVNNLKTAIKTYDDIEAREKLALASVFTGLCQNHYDYNIAKNLSIANALSAYYPSLPLGVSLSFVSINFFQTILECQPCRFLKLAKIFNPDAVKPSDFISELKKFISDIGLNKCCIQNYGFDEKNTKIIAQNAFDSMDSLFDVTDKKFDFHHVYSIIQNSLH